MFTTMSSKDANRDCSQGDESDNESKATYTRLIELTNFMLEDPDNVVLHRFEGLHILDLLVQQHKLADCSREIQLYFESDYHPNIEHVFTKLGGLLKNFGE